MIASCRNFFFDKILFYTYCFALNFSSLNFYFVFNSFFFFQIFVDTNRLNNCLENRIVNFLPPLSMRSFRVTRNTARMDKIFRLYRRKFYRSKKCFFYHFRFIKLFRITEKYKMNTQLKLFKNSTVTTGTFLPHSFLLSHKILHRN